jgi:ATP-dependent DNA helicase RecQ
LRAGRDSVPAYVVAPNSSLADIARRRPPSVEELVEIKGFGETRAEKYGDEILAILREQITANVPG